MDNCYSLEVKKIFKGAEEIMMELSHPYVGTEHLLLSLLKNSKEVKDIGDRYELSYDEFLYELKRTVGTTVKKNDIFIYTPLLKKVIRLASNMAREKEITPVMLFMALIEEGEGIAIRILYNLDIDVDKMYNELKNKGHKSNSKLEIYNIGKNLGECVSFDDVLVGRDNELNLIIETLIRKNKNNPLLVGDAGVGKSAIVEELARRINKGNVPRILKDKKIVSLEMSSLVAGTKYRGEFEEKLNKIIGELESNPDIILFIDEMHTMVNAGGAEGAVNASDILKPYLARGKIKIIGATTTNEYNKFILKDKALTRRFELIKIKEPNLVETKNILEKLIPSFSKFYNIKITSKNVSEIVDLTNKYIMNRYNPDKSIDLLDSVCAMKYVENNYDEKIKKLKVKKDKVIKKKEKMVCNGNFEEATILRSEEIKLDKKIKEFENKPVCITSNDIREILYRKNNIPIKKDTKDGELRKYLQSKLIGQDKPIENIIECLKLKKDDYPLSMLLTGSTGVGKTKTVKEISDYLKMPLIRLDMSEYNSEITVNRLIGASAGYIGYDDEAIFDKIRVTPHAIILIDEIEKAHPSVLNLFLQILDEGFVTNTRGEKIDFKNTIIFMTSNAKVNKRIGFFEGNGNYQNNFSKEFLARINEIIPFNNITEEMVLKYLKNMGIKDLSVIKEFDYHNLGFRGLDRYLEKKKILVDISKIK